MTEDDLPTPESVYAALDAAPEALLDKALDAASTRPGTMRPTRADKILTLRSLWTAPAISLQRRHRLAVSLGLHSRAAASETYQRSQAESAAHANHLSRIAICVSIVSGLIALVALLVSILK